MSITATVPRTRPTGRLGAWGGRRPVLAFFALTYLISWTLWLPWALGLRGGAGGVLFVLGGFGPPAAAAILIKARGGSLRSWVRGILRWRFPVRYYAYALGLPLALFAVVNLVLALIGRDLDLAALSGHLGPYLATFVFILLLGGGMEEPGWRGYALPRLQQRFSPLAATAILGMVWGVWHIPAYGTPAAVVVPFLLAFFYTWLYNRTGSVLLCILLHASFTPAQGLMVLTEDSLAVDLAILGTYVGAVLLLVWATRGRLGLAPRAVSSESLPTATTRLPVASHS